MQEFNWTNFKLLVDAKQASIQCVIDLSGSNYHLYLVDGSFVASCILPINVGNSDTEDFENNYKNNGNKSIKSKVLTEPANISITLYKSTDIVDVNANSSATIDFELEQEGDELQQILYGGALYAENPDFKDYVKFQVIDKNNVLGYGANTVLKEYIVKAYLDNSGKFEDYDEAGAYLPVGLFLRCIYTNEKTLGTTKVKINYLLGIPN